MRRIFAFISGMVMLDVSSKNMLVCASTSATRARSCQFSLESCPVRKAWLSMAASLDSTRFTSWSFVISRLKIATGTFCFLATLVAMFRANDVLPMPGRAARMIRSDRPRPVSMVSK